MMNNDKAIENFIEYNSVNQIINLAMDIENTAVMIRTECQKTEWNRDKDVLRALLKSLTRITEEHLIDKKEDIKVEQAPPKNELVVGIKLEGADEVIQQLREIENQLKKIYTPTFIDKKKALDVLTKDLGLEMEQLNKVTEEVMKRIAIKLKSNRLSEQPTW